MFFPPVLSYVDLRFSLHEDENLKDKAKEVFTRTDLRILLPSVTIGAALLTMAFLYTASLLLGLRVIGIFATYDGPTREGTVLDSKNDGFSVTARLVNGTQKALSNWEISRPALMKKGTSSTVTITSGRW